MKVSSDDKIIEIKINDKNYALVSLCLFHDMDLMTRYYDVKEQFGLIDKFETFHLFEITDEMKLALCKFKYGID